MHIHLQKYCIPQFVFFELSFMVSCRVDVFHPYEQLKNNFKKMKKNQVLSYLLIVWSIIWPHLLYILSCGINVVYNRFLNRLPSLSFFFFFLWCSVELLLFYTRVYIVEKRPWDAMEDQMPCSNKFWILSLC